MPETHDPIVVDRPTDQESEERKVMLREALGGYQKITQDYSQERNARARLQVEYGSELIPEIIAMAKEGQLDTFYATLILAGLEATDQDLYFAAQSIASLPSVHGARDLSSLGNAVELMIATGRANLLQLEDDSQ